MFSNDPGYPMRLAICFILVCLVLFLLIALIPSKSDAAEFYQFTDRDGVIHFVSRAEDVPKAYQSQVVLRDTDAVASDKITPHNTTAHAEALSARLERLREINARPSVKAEPVPSRSATPYVHQSPLQPDEGTRSMDTVHPDDAVHPLVRQRERWQFGMFHKSTIVVRDALGRVVSLDAAYPVYRSGGFRHLPPNPEVDPGPSEGFQPEPPQQQEY